MGQSGSSSIVYLNSYSHEIIFLFLYLLAFAALCGCLISVVVLITIVVGADDCVNKLGILLLFSSVELGLDLAGLTATLFLLLLLLHFLIIYGRD